MSKYSRTSKYEDLRNRLQNDAESELSTNDLVHFEKRLNNISPHNFDAPQSNSQIDDHDPIHARRKQQFASDENKPQQTEQSSHANLPHSAISNTDNYATTAFNNEYLNEYINEVKRYNIDQGNAFSTNTEVNILRSLRGDVPEPKVPVTPFPDEIKPEENLEIPDIPAVIKEPVIKPIVNQAPTFNSSQDETTDIPSFHTNKSDDLFNDFMGLDEELPEVDLSNNKTRDDIAKEVQSLISGQTTDTDPFLSSATTSSLSALNVTNENIEADRTTRQQLLNETTQMRAQLDDYEDNLSEVNDKMDHQSKVMNTILIVLIVALIIVLGVVVYWVLTTKGII